LDGVTRTRVRANQLRLPPAHTPLLFAHLAADTVNARAALERAFAIRTFSRRCCTRLLPSSWHSLTSPAGQPTVTCRRGCGLGGRPPGLTWAHSHHLTTAGHTNCCYLPASCLWTCPITLLTACLAGRTFLPGPLRHHTTCLPLGADKGLPTPSFSPFSLPFALNHHALASIHLRAPPANNA